MATFCKPIKCLEATNLGYSLFGFEQNCTLDHQYYLALHDEPDGQGDIGAGVYRETVIRG